MLCLLAQPVVKVVRSTDIQRKLKTKNIISTDQYNNQVRGPLCPQAVCSPVQILAMHALPSVCYF